MADPRGRRSRFAVPAAILLCIATFAARPGPARAGIPFDWQYPGGCGGAATLQDCIDHANAGDTIDIVTDTPIDEHPDVEKSLTLRGGGGFHPTISEGVSIFANSGTIHVALAGLAFGAGVDVNFPGGSGHSVDISNVAISTDSFSAPVYFDVSVPSSVEVTGSSLHSGEGGGPGIELFAHHPAGVVEFRAIGNRIDAHGTASSGSGVDVIASGTGTTNADVESNSIWDVAGCGCGGEAGISVDAGDTVHAAVNVVGNTVNETNGQHGLNVHTSLTSGGAVAVDAFDNVFVNVGSGINVKDTDQSADLFRSGFNDRFAVANPDDLEGRSAGPGNLAVKPRFVDGAGGDLRLQPGSPLLDAGVVCSPGGVAGVDAAGMARLAGPSVDMGAYEIGAVAPTGEALVGTSGNDVLTGTDGADILCGSGGADTLNGGDGADYVSGGRAGDVAHGGAGRDVVDGGPGPDQLFGDTGADVVIGGSGPDSISGGPGNDPCLRSKDRVGGNDHVDGGTGTDGALADPGDHLTNVEHPGACG